jgi:hypothetical protein
LILLLHFVDVFDVFEELVVVAYANMNKATTAIIISPCKKQKQDEHDD